MFGVFLNLSKIFDTVQHKRPISQFETIGIKAIALKLSNSTSLLGCKVSELGKLLELSIVVFLKEQ